MPHDTSFQMCIARIFIRVVTAANRQTSSHICVQDVITTCCSTDSKTLHRCRQLPNKVENIEQTLDVSHTLHWIAKCSTKLHLPLGESQAPHHIHGSLVPRVYTPNGTLISSIIFEGLTVVTNRQSYRPWNISDTRQLFIHCCDMAK